MNCNWLNSTTSLLKGVKLNNSLDDTKYEHFIRRIVIKLRNKDKEIFTEEERKRLESIFQLDEQELLFAIKTIIYIFNRALKFVFMPNELKNDLSALGFNEDKIETILKVWSSETSFALKSLASNVQKSQDSIKFNWKLNSEISSDYHKRSKIPLAYLSISNGNDGAEIEMPHSELHSMFLQFESIQNEIDHLLS